MIHPVSPEWRRGQAETLRGGPHRNAPAPATPLVPPAPASSSDTLPTDTLPLAAVFAAGSAPAPPKLTAPPNLARVLAALEAEAQTLRHAEAAAGLADQTLDMSGRHARAAADLATRLLRPAELTADQVVQLRDQLADHHLAVARITSAAAYRGVPLFDGQYRLRVGGGKLDLPNLARSAPTLHALDTLRGDVQHFRQNVVAQRLHSVEAALQRTAQTRAMYLETSTAVSAATLRGYRGLAVGSLLDVRA